MPPSSLARTLPPRRADEAHHREGGMRHQGAPGARWLHPQPEEGRFSGSACSWWKDGQRAGPEEVKLREHGEDAGLTVGRARRQRVQVDLSTPDQRCSQQTRAEMNVPTPAVRVADGRGFFRG